MKDNHKVAIMTWHSYWNYGSVLQASALCHVADNMGYEPVLVQYPPKGGVADAVKINLGKRVFDKICSKINPVYESIERENLFVEYLQNRVSYTERCVSYPELHDLNEKYQAFICGSDQIWSPLCYDSKYFLDFVENTDKMIAYAPSMGTSKIENEVIRRNMAEQLFRFKSLSVREQQGAELIRKLTGKNAKVVLDPTLLMNAAEWDVYAETAEVQKVSNEKYILCYFLGKSEKYMGYVKTLSKRLKLPFYVIPVTARQKKEKNAVPFEVGPKEFVSLIRNASYVCTDSFHGVAFSVNYNIPFSVFRRFKDNDPKNQNSRVFHLLKLLKLEKRLTDYQKKDAIEVETVFDFNEANKQLELWRKDSAEYLADALGAAVHVLKNDEEKRAYKITDRCCGCGACATVCTKNAISIKRDVEGFEQYEIDMAKCVQCGLCKTVCPMTDISAQPIKNSVELYSVKSKSVEVLKKSSSGGVAYEVALNLIDEGYSVCGCIYDNEDNIAKHIWIVSDEKEKLALLQGSKYIQSRTSEALKQTAEKTKENKIVFFGTPCQVAAVDKLLQKKGLRERALLVDLICHGVPTSYLWEKYLREIDKSYGTGKHPEVLFRSKEHEWRLRLLLVKGNGHVYKRDERKDDFYAFFRRGLCDMKACSDCPYRERSSADLRIGDYWGERFVNDKQGVSMVIANTDEGAALIKRLKKNGVCQIKTHDLEEYWSVQYPYNPKYPLVREKLIEELRNDKVSLHSLRRKYCSYYDRVEFVYSIAAYIKKFV